jgi:hypothetical protein
MARALPKKMRNIGKLSGLFPARCRPEGARKLSPGFQSISADSMRGPSIGEWLNGFRPGGTATIVARHEVPGEQAGTACRSK